MGAADFLGTRKDTDKEQARLYRALARRIQRNGVSGLRSQDHLAIEIQLYHATNSREPLQEREIRTRLCAETERGTIATSVDCLFGERSEGGAPHQGIEGMLDLVDHAEEIALKARQGITSNGDLFQMP